MNETHFLAPQKLKICLKEGELFLKMDGQKLKLAAPKRALPFSNPDEYIVLSDEDGAEIGVLRSLDDLEPQSRERLAEKLAQAYHSTVITRVLEVEREPLSGQVRWRVEIEDGEAIEPLPDDIDNEIEANTSPFRLLRRSKNDETTPETPRREQTFFIGGAEDVKNARYPQIFLVDVEGNRYEIPNCEALDLASRRAAERFY
ncbi:MAG TPA: DUF1854 domain-containing protein [Abditibacterium sp.]|jgi:hypothetical protein